MDFRETDKNILVLGSTGTGKSSFCNFLFNKECDKGPFKTSNSKLTCTKSLTYATMDFGTHRVNIIDSPGLNEPDFTEDISNLSSFITKLSQFGHLNLIIFYALDEARDDNQTVKTYQYYKSVFSDIITGGNVVFVGSKCTPERWDEYSENDWALYLEKQEEFASEMKKYLNMAPNYCHVANVKIPEKKRKEVEKAYNDGKLWDSVYTNTLWVRDNLLECLVELENKYLKNMYFELPPTASLVFKNVITHLKLQQQELINKLENFEAKALTLALTKAKEGLLKLRNEAFLKMIYYARDVRKDIDYKTDRKVLGDIVKYSFAIPPQFAAYKKLQFQMINSRIKTYDVENGMVYVKLKVLSHLKMYKSTCYLVFDGTQFNKLEFERCKNEYEGLMRDIQINNEALKNIVGSPQTHKINDFLDTYDRSIFNLSEFEAILKIFLHHKISETKFDIAL